MEGGEYDVMALKRCAPHLGIDTTTGDVRLDLIKLITCLKAYRKMSSVCCGIFGGKRMALFFRLRPALSAPAIRALCNDIATHSKIIKTLKPGQQS
jgi:hypothetical protein